MRKIELCPEKTENSKYDEQIGYYKVIEEGRESISIITNYARKQICYISSEEDIKNILLAGYEFVNTPAKIGEWMIIKSSDKVLHNVKPGQTLKDIANMYNTSEQNLIKINKLSHQKLFIGQTLIIKQ